MSTYKREVERTEQLGSDYQAALDGIITEIKKDDNLSANRILDVVGCIQSIKGNRKRWASGGSSSLTEITSDGAVLDLRNVPFELGIVHVTNYLPPIDNYGWYWGAERHISLDFVNDYYQFDDASVWLINNKWYAMDGGRPRIISNSKDINTITGVNDQYIKEKLLSIQNKKIKLRFLLNDSYRNNLKWTAYER